MKLLLKLFYLLSLVLVAGCGHLRLDPVMAAITANYPTAEIMGCGKRWHGLGICPIVKGQPYSGARIGVQVYHEGTLVIDSKDCEINVIMSYKKSQLIPVHIPGLADRTCVVTVTISPKYPGEGDQDIKVYSFRGHIVLRALDSVADLKQWEGHVRKVTGSFSSEIKLWVGPGAGNVLVFMEGCGMENPYRETIPELNGWVVFNLKDVLPPKMMPKTCVLEGYARSGPFKDVLVNVAVSKYDPAFLPLGVPLVEMNGNNLSCKGSKAVSIIALNDKWEVDMEANFDNFNPKGFNILRLLTVGGRSAIGTWDVRAKKWKWQR